MPLIGVDRSRGDTLIEVLFAVTTFSLLAVAALSIMNQGTSIAQRALEISLVRQEIDAQAETLRFLNSSYVSAFQQHLKVPEGYPITTPAGQWSALIKEIKDNGASNVTAFGVTADNKCPNHPNTAFILNSRTAKYQYPTNSDFMRHAQTFSQVRYNEDGVILSADGIWVEASIKEGEAANSEYTNYVDFHIRACWDSPGQVLPVTLGTIVRLYEPRLH